MIPGVDAHSPHAVACEVGAERLGGAHLLGPGGEDPPARKKPRVPLQRLREEGVAHGRRVLPGQGVSHDRALYPEAVHVCEQLAGAVDGLVCIRPRADPAINVEEAVRGHRSPS